jgi:hypothetical protein
MKKLLLTTLSVVLLMASANLSNAQVGKSLNFNGTTDFFEVSDHNAFDLDSSVTIEAWINPDTVSTLMVVARKGWCNGSQASYYVGIKEGKILWRWDEDGDCTAANAAESIDSVITPGVCTHIAVVHTHLEVKMYVNGNAVSAIKTAGNYSTMHKGTAPFRVGAYQAKSGGVGNYFDGDIDEVRVWKTARSANDIKDWSHGIVNSSDPDLVAYYRMEDGVSGENETITNSSALGTDLDGTTVGSNTTPMEVTSCATTGIKETNTQIDGKIFPNPTSDELNIKLEGIGAEVNVKILDITGKQVSSRNYTNTGVIKESIGALANGVYFVIVNTPDGVYSQKIIKN